MSADRSCTSGYRSYRTNTGNHAVIVASARTANHRDRSTDTSQVHACGNDSFAGLKTFVHGDHVPVDIAKLDRSQPGRFDLSVSFGDRLHDRLMLVAGTLHALAMAQLRAPKGVEPGADGDRLLGEKGIVRGAADRIVEFEIEPVVSVEITAIDHCL